MYAYLVGAGLAEPDGVRGREIVLPNADRPVLPLDTLVIVEPTDSRDGRVDVGVERAEAVAMRRCGMRDGVRSSVWRESERERHCYNLSRHYTKPNCIHAGEYRKAPPTLETLTRAVQRQRRTVPRRRLRAGPAQWSRVRLGTVARAARRQPGAAGRVRRFARRVARAGRCAGHTADAGALVVAERIGRRGGDGGARWP